MRVLFVAQTVTRSRHLPAVPAVGDTVHMYGQRRQVTHVEWDLEADESEDLITVYLGEVR